MQYHCGLESRPRQVVPDNMVVLHTEPIKANWSFNLPLQPVRPYWVIDYLSMHTNRKDYADNFRIYERELKVPYCLRIDTDRHEPMLYRHTGRNYIQVTPNNLDRLEIPELELEMGLLGERIRYWHRQELLLLPHELLRELENARRQTDEVQKRHGRAGR